MKKDGWNTRAEERTPRGGERRLVTSENFVAHASVSDGSVQSLDKEENEREERRRQEYRRCLCLQRAHQSLTPFKAQAECGRRAAWVLPESGSRERVRSRHPVVELYQEVETKRVKTRNVTTCGSVWCCPSCAIRITHARVQQILRIDRYLREERGHVTYMLTLTVPHSSLDSLEIMRKAVADGWRMIRQDREWRTRWQGELGYVGDMRALEVTHGPNGFHPHLHVLLYVREDLLTRDEQEEIRTKHSRNEPYDLPGVLGEFRKWVYVRWRTMAHMHGLDTPDFHRGVHISPVHSAAKYIAKSGLVYELFSDGKTGRNGNRAMAQVLSDVADHGRRADIETWRRYTIEIAGAQQITMSKTLREVRRLLGIPDLTDKQIAEIHDEITALNFATLDAMEAYVRSSIGGLSDQEVQLDMLPGEGARPAETWLEIVENDPEAAEVGVYLPTPERARRHITGGVGNRREWVMVCAIHSVTWETHCQAFPGFPAAVREAAEQGGGIAVKRLILRLQRDYGLPRERWRSWRPEWEGGGVHESVQQYHSASAYAR